MADATDRASAVTEAHAQAMRMMEAHAQQAEEKASMLSVMYEQMKDERNAGVHRFCNWVAGQVTVVGFDNLFPLVEAWGYECGWHETADGKTAITKLLDEFKASSGVMVVPVPAAATTPLPLPHTSVAKVGGEKVNDGCNGATALYVGTRPEIDQPPNGKLCGTPHPGAHPFRREGQAKDPRYTRIGEAIAKTEIPRRVNRRGGRFKFPNVGFPPALWPLNATFTYVASRLLTIELLEMLKDIGIDEPKEVFFSMAEVAEKFVKNGCPRPRKPYPFVSMVVEDDIPGLEWSHGLDPPPTRNFRTVRTLRP
ncbi:hypothetical protein DYB37_014083 [Aphanomyces astaci]|uniref:Uncharacterized protein n=1 Tax=Aphanomyces astaci TaxID=112090 RepID=A0A3R7EPN9_APHAT|nr:hypothetical protein DYB37_014083 [Aphanomyces astaci]